MDPPLSYPKIRSALTLGISGDSNEIVLLNSDNLSDNKEKPLYDQTQNVIPSIAEAAVDPHAPGHRACAVQVQETVAEISLLSLIVKCYFQGNLSKELYASFQQFQREVNLRNRLDLQYDSEKI